MFQNEINSDQLQISCQSFQSINAVNEFEFKIKTINNLDCQSKIQAIINDMKKKFQKMKVNYV